MARSSKRDEIIAAAVRLLAREGAASLTAASLAREAGVSKANVFHHFETLNAVVLAALEAFLLGMDSMRPQPGTSLRDWLLGLGAETVAQMDDDPALAGAYFAFAARAQADPDLRQRLARMVETAEARFAEALELLAPERFTGAERGRLAALILITGDGLALHRQLFPQRRASQLAAWAVFVDSIAPEESETS
jgi:AcrR family transcriptional regulator